MKVSKNLRKSIFYVHLHILSTEIKNILTVIISQTISGRNMLEITNGFESKV